MSELALHDARCARPAARRRSPALGLGAICLGFLMITLDATIVNVALAPIVSDLGGSLSAAQWIVNGYTLAFAALLLSAGALADRVGARAGFLIGLGIFGLGSALCSVATSMDVLIAARVLQGMGAAWLMPCSLALVAHNFPDAVGRRRALAIWGGASGVGLASGPILGGVLTAEWAGAPSSSSTFRSPWWPLRCWAATWPRRGGTATRSIRSGSIGRGEPGSAHGRVHRRRRAGLARRAHARRCSGRGGRGHRVRGNRARGPPPDGRSRAVRAPVVRAVGEHRCDLQLLSLWRALLPGHRPARGARPRRV